MLIRITKSLAICFHIFFTSKDAHAIAQFQHGISKTIESTSPRRMRVRMTGNSSFK
ncbi:MAG: hypothetical protein IPJ74_13260 [Saprospiraceae bacterium]|nr:hypothetical protein [Saprospiraceae bacterium]